MDALYLVFGVFLFIAVVLLVEGAYLMWNTSKGPEAKRIARRLRLMSAGTSLAGDEVSILKSRMLSETPIIERLLLQAPPSDRTLPPLVSRYRGDAGAFAGRSRAPSPHQHQVLQAWPKTTCRWPCRRTTRRWRERTRHHPPPQDTLVQAPLDTPLPSGARRDRAAG